MRVLVPTTILLLVMGLPATSWSAPAPKTPTSEIVERPPVTGNMPDDVAVPDQSHGPSQSGGQGETAGACAPCGPCDSCGPCQPCGPSEAESEPGVLATVFGRFLNPCECDPHWSFSADAVALQRSSARSQPLFTGLATIAAPPTLLNAGDMNFPTTLGFQLDAVRRGPCGWEWEVGYFQIDGFNSNSAVPGDSFLVTSSDGGGFAVTDGAAQYRSALHLAEINLRRQWGCDGLTLLIGFRTGELDELYAASGSDANGGLAGSINANTYNHLYGLQTGAIYEFYNMGGPLRVSAMCKAGIYGDSAIQSTRVIETGTSDNVLAAHRNQAAFIGETGATVSYDVTCHLSFHAFCEAMWIEGVALRTEQIGANDFTNLAASIDTHGGIFYYGGGLGAELKF